MVIGFQIADFSEFGWQMSLGLLGGGELGSPVAVGLFFLCLDTEMLQLSSGHGTRP